MAREAYGVMASVEVLAGSERRRRWSVEQKQAIVAAAFGPGAVARDVARQADVQTFLDVPPMAKEKLTAVLNDADQCPPATAAAFGLEGDRQFESLYPSKAVIGWSAL
jgi:hypothetical protein